LGQVAAEIRSNGGEVVGVAVTATFSQLAFAERLGLDFPLLSDWDREVCAAYGVRYDVWKGHAGLAKRSLFVIDGQGVIRYAWSTDDALELPDLEPVMATLRRLPEPSSPQPDLLGRETAT
jgi:glutaredoxin-dependent peroxiredoxin